MKRHTTLFLFFLVVIIGFVLSPRIGSAWDEPDNMFSGGVYVNFFQHRMDSAYFGVLTDKASAYGDRIIPNDHMLSHLPPLHNYVGVFFILAAQALHIHVTAPVIIIAWHLATVLFFALLVATTYRFGILLGLSRLPSVVAALLVFLYPQLFGHGLSNSKDIAQAAMITFALYYLVRGSRVAGGVVWGLAMATKFNAVYVPIIWGVWGIRGVGVVRVIKRISFILVIGLLTMYMVWPYLWYDPIGHVKEMISYFLTVGRGYPVLWNGKLFTVGVGNSLWWYPWASLAVTTPLTVLALIAVGIVAFLRSLKRNRVLLLLPIWILIPMVRIVSPWSAFYDQLRHFLEIIPAFMLMSALALDWMYKKWRYLAIGIAVAAVGELVWINAVYFPYSTGYYNMFAGNPNVNFDRDIEGLSMKEGMDWLHGHYGPVFVWAPIAAHLTWPYLSPGDRYVFLSENGPDSVIVINKQSHSADSSMLWFVAHRKDFTLVHTIGRGDAIFGWVYRKSTVVK